MFGQAVWPHSGHYRPTKENSEEFMTFLKENNVDITDIQVMVLTLNNSMLLKRKGIKYSIEG